MANIEIISVRFNLAKDDDRRLFAALRRRSDPGKRNEFIKQVLLESLTDDGRVNTVARSLKKKKKGPVQEESVTTQQHLEIAETTETVAPGPLSSLSSVPDSLSLQPARERDASTNEPDPEAAGLVGSFVQ